MDSVFLYELIDEVLANISSYIYYSDEKIISRANLAAAISILDKIDAPLSWSSVRPLLARFPEEDYKHKFLKFIFIRNDMDGSLSDYLSTILGGFNTDEARINALWILARECANLNAETVLKVLEKFGSDCYCAEALKIMAKSMKKKDIQIVFDEFKDDAGMMELIKGIQAGID